MKFIYKYTQSKCERLISNNNIHYIAKVFTEYTKDNSILDQNTCDAEVQRREALCQ